MSGGEISGGNSFDYLRGEEGNDTIYGGEDADNIRGDAGADYCYGDAGDDDLRGGADNDKLNGGAGIDKLFGEAGADQFVFAVDSLGASDRVKDFSIAEGDSLVLDGIFTGFDALTSTITDFIQINNDAGMMDILIDRDGSASGYAFEQIAVLEHVTGLDTQTLYAVGTLAII